MILEGYKATIYTGVFQKGTEEQKENMRELLGSDGITELYETYFHWYNIMHEFGHMVVEFNRSEEIGVADEEQLVNDFAVAYWEKFGERDKLKFIETKLETLLSEIRGPINCKENYLSYARKCWKEVSSNSSNYGWFQFNSVLSALRTNQSLEEVLVRMGIKKDSLMATITSEKLFYKIDSDTPQAIVNDAVRILSNYGVKIVPVKVQYTDNPEVHKIECEEI